MWSCPNTLPQDFTLFVLMKETDNRIWKQKLDWIAAHGGMAFLNTHSRLYAVQWRHPGTRNVPVGVFPEFLEYVQEKYRGKYWSALPQETARVFRQQVVGRR